MSKTFYRSMKPRLTRFLLATATGLAALGMGLQAANAWVLTNGDASGAGTKLDVANPSTGNLAAQLSCIKHPQSGNYSVLSLSADVATLQDGAQSNVTLYTQGGTFKFQGIAIKRAISGGIDGISFSVTNNDPLWQALRSSSVADYQVNQTSPVRLDLAPSQGKIGDFVSLCSNIRTAQSALPTPVPKVPQIGQTQQQAQASDSASGAGIDPTEATAFQFAQQINSPQAYKLFITTYPNSPLAAMARAALGQNGTAAVQQQTEAPAQPTVAAAQTTSAPLKPYMTKPGKERWVFKSSNAGFDATVENAGVRLKLSCPIGAPGYMAIALEKAKSGEYPELIKRMILSANANPAVKISFDGGNSYDVPMALGEDVSGQALKGFVDPNTKFINDLIKQNTVTMQADPFGAAFKLRASKDAVCKLSNQCGIVADGCSSSTKAVSKKQPTQNHGVTKQTQRTICKSRSVYVEGRGCILKKYAKAAAVSKKQPAKNNRVTKCKSRSVYVEGRGCILRKYAKAASKKSSKKRKRAQKKNTRCRKRSVYVAGRGCILRRYAN